MKEKNIDKLIQWGYKVGVLTGKTEDFHLMKEEVQKFAIAEIISRVEGIKALKKENPDLKIKQKFLYCHWDMEFISGGTLQRLEHKHRTYTMDNFPDYMISTSKKEDIPDYWYMNTFEKDGEYKGYIIWDLKTASITQRYNVHNKKTVVPEAGKVRKLESFLKREDAFIYEDRYY